MTDTVNELLVKIKEGSLSIDERRDVAAQLGAEPSAVSDEALLLLMRDEDELVRYNAINSAGFDHHLMAAKGLLLGMVKNDPDVDCRDASASALGNIFQNSQDREVLAGLREVALTDPDGGVRRSAYKSAIITSGVSREEHLALLQDQSEGVNRILLDAATGKLN